MSEQAQSAQHTPLMCKPVSAIKRTRLTAVYLTATERDLVVGALQTLRAEIAAGVRSYDQLEAKFAKSFTARRIDDVCALFADKAEGSAS